MKIVIATGSWPPTISGVVRTLQSIIPIVEKQMGHSVHVLSPNLFARISYPMHPELKLSFPFLSSIQSNLPKEFDAVHIMTECFLGLQVSRYCDRHGLPFTTSYTTDVADILHTHKIYIPKALVRKYLCGLHKRSQKIMVATPTLKKKLQSWGLEKLAYCSRGVDTKLFFPRKIKKPGERILLFVGRTSKEKNVQAFLDCKVHGKKYLVGDSPERAKLERRYPEARFLGYLHGEKLAETFAMADLLVFPSKTDTFGLVILEALASGVPVAAYPVQGPIDIITDPRLGCLSENLEEAIEVALERGDPEYCRAYAETFSWENCARQFVENLVPIRAQIK